MDQETSKQQVPISTEINIALLQKDVGNILKTLEKIDIRTETYEKIFARKEELTTLEKTIDKHYVDLKEDLKKKVDHEEFKPIKDTLTRLNWLVITAVVVGLLSLIIKVP